MRRLSIPVLALSFGGLAPSPAEVAEQPSANGALQRKPMAGDSAEPGPVGRGRLPLPEFTEDGSWVAAYSAQEVRVRLGESSYIVTLTKAEDGSYWRGSMEVLSGTTMIFPPDGKRYRLFWQDGRWVGVEVSG